MDVDLDHPGIGRDAEVQDARIAGRRVALDEDRLALLLGGVLERRHQVEIILHALGRRHEDMEMTVARLEGHRGPHDAGGRSADRGPEASVRCQSASPRLATRFGVAGKSRFLATQHRRAPEGVERRQVGMRRHRIGLDDDVCVAGGRPWQRIERQAIADRRITGDQVALLGAQEPRAALPSRRMALPVSATIVIANNRQHVADRTFEPLLENARQALALQRILHLRFVDHDVARQAPLAPQVVPGVLIGREKIVGV